MFTVLNQESLRFDPNLKSYATKAFLYNRLLIQPATNFKEL